MASVFIARHKRTGGLVAVKVLADELAEVPEIVERFIQEARTAATLDGHPNVISIFDIGDSNGMYYLLMPFLVGEDVGKYLKREGRLSPNDAANVISQTLHGLNWAHRKGVVHRDIKPANLYLDQNGRVVVVDFGIAKLRDVPSLQTQANVRLGTTYYMCPEQIRGDACDGRSDLYTLGVVFYELLTGKRPFVGSTEQEVLTGHLERRPPELRALDSSIPQAYAEIVNKLLEKDPHQRFQTASEVIVKLEALGQYGLPGQIHPTIKWKVPDGPTSESPPPPVTPTPEQLMATRTAPERGPSTTLDRVAVEPVQIPAKSKNKFLLPIGLLGLALALAAGVWFWLSGQKHAAPAVTATAPAIPNGPTSQLPAMIRDSNHKTLGLVKGGAFIFGSDSEESPNPWKAITLPAFYIDLTEVTVKEYRDFCAATGRKLPPELAGAADDLPVTNVSWNDAEAYASWMGKRLPTEEEWEKAARGESGRIFPWGNTAWARGLNGPPDHLVGVERFPDRTSPVGAYNMAGNAAEWTASVFPENKRNADDFNRLFNGKPYSPDWYAVKGGYFSADKKLDFFFRTYMRRPYPKDQSSPFIGFRCIEDPPK